MRVLVSGSAGMLARDLVPCLSERGHEVAAPPEDELDVTDIDRVTSAANSSKPDLIVNCAAYTNVDGAEAEEDEALRLNGYAVQNLCLVCRESGIPLVHFSTDYVFDGASDHPYRIDDSPNPTTAYGRTKLTGEQHVLQSMGEFYLIRTAWLFGHHGKNFVETMLDLGRSRRQISVVNDQKGCPTWTRDLAAATAGLIESGRYGVYHVTNSEPTTWFGFATEIFRLSGMDVEVLPTTTEQFPRPARRPANSVLDPFPLPQVLGREMPSWREALGEYLRLRKG
jgi:dTDP-4-dehydrorhamnose reductase